MAEYEPTFDVSPNIEPTLGSLRLDERKVRHLVTQHIADILDDDYYGGEESYEC